MRRRAARRGLGVAALVAVAGFVPIACGSGRPGLTAVEQNQLLGLVRQARSSAAGGDPAAAEKVLTDLRTAVSQLRAAGVLDPVRAARLQGVAAQAQSAARAQADARAAQSAPRSPPAPHGTTTPRSPAAPAAPPAAGAAPSPLQIIVKGAGDARAKVQQELARLKDRLKRAVGVGGGGQGGGGGD